MSQVKLGVLTPFTSIPNRVRSEYDEYREKYRLFDSALFCMPPDNCLRKVCNKILTAQLSAPSSSHTSETQDLRSLPARRVKFMFQ